MQCTQAACSRQELQHATSFTEPFPLPAIRTVLAAGTPTTFVPQALRVRHSCCGQPGGSSAAGGSAAARQRSDCMAAAPPGRTVVVLFRNDLRLHDNPVLQAVVEEAARPITEGQVEVIKF